jgi:hypothetical protein
LEAGAFVLGLAAERQFPSRGLPFGARCGDAQRWTTGCGKSRGQSSVLNICALDFEFVWDLVLRIWDFKAAPCLNC